MRRSLAQLLVLGLACTPTGSERPQPPGEPAAVAPAPATDDEPTPTKSVEDLPVVAEAAAKPEEQTEVDADATPVDEPPEKLWKPNLEPRILAVQPIVAAAAEEYGVDPHLVNGVIWVESKFDRKARNRSGARGLMQLMPKTAKSIGRRIKRPTRVFDAEFNVHAGTWYLSRLLAKFDGDEDLALAAYVRGPSKIRAWVEEEHPFPDGVLGFVTKVQRAQRVFESLGWPAVEAPPPEEIAKGSTQ